MNREEIFGLTLGAFLAGKARRNGDKVCIDYLLDGRRLTYAQLEDEANRLAAGLKDLGLAAGAHVAVLSDNRPEQIVLYFSLAKLGGVCVPINTAARGSFLSYLLQQSDTTAIVVEPEYLAQLAEVIAELPALTTLVVLESVTGASQDLSPELARLRTVDFDALMAGPAGPIPESIDNAQPSDLAQILYTSGTTGRSKGNMFAHTAMLNWGRQVAAGHGLTEDDIYFVVFPLFHAGAWLSCVMAAMWVNGTVALGRGFSASRFLDQVRGCGATVVFVVSVASFLSAQPASGADRDHKLTKFVTAPPPPDPLAFERRFGVRLLAGYGLSDYGSSHFRGLSSPPGKIGSSGTLCPGWEAKCVDDLGRTAPPGAPGEILLRCNIPGGAARGYYKMPQETLDSRRDLWFHTGDIGTIDADGYLYFLDRKKDAIRRRGENISSIEMELILGLDPGVGASAFFPVKSEVAEDDVAVAVIPRAGHPLTEEDVARYCEANVPKYAVPRYIRIVESFPMTASGKVQKVILRQETEAMLPNVWDREKRRAAPP